MHWFNDSLPFSTPPIQHPPLLPREFFRNRHRNVDAGIAMATPLAHEHPRPECARRSVAFLPQIQYVSLVRALRLDVPSGFTPMKKSSSGTLTAEQKADQDKRYGENHQYDYVIIGTGNATLTVGALLAHAGKKICILEAYDTEQNS